LITHTTLRRIQLNLKSEVISTLGKNPKYWRRAWMISRIRNIELFLNWASKTTDSRKRINNGRKRKEMKR